MSNEFENLVFEIYLFNKAWKRTGVFLEIGDTITNLFRDIKSFLQVRLIRDYKDKITLEYDENYDKSEELISIILKTPLKINGAIIKYAAHIPVRVLKDFMTENELKQLLKGK
ncbi:MAG: hypothetical protein GXP49_08090 [Deltaproteobacteria bacterium]|nr:hypothetical protein [Deltaproteobacteria bacterium]